MTSDQFNFDRFVKAQEQSYATALEELRSGKKRSHWVWYFFPQLRSLGRSDMAMTFGLADLAEAQAYLNHPILRQRLMESVAALLTISACDVRQVLGDLDALKLRSCLTLFSIAAPAEGIFSNALDILFNGNRDPLTLKLLTEQIKE